jgi:hypothetical protein
MHNSTIICNNERACAYVELCAYACMYICVIVCACMRVCVCVRVCVDLCTHPVWLLVTVLVFVCVLLLRRRRHTFRIPFVSSRPLCSPPARPSRASTADLSTGRLGIPAPRAKVHPPSASACTTGPASHTVRRPSAPHPPQCSPTVWFGIKLLLLWCGGGGCGPGLVLAQSSLSCPAGSFFNATTARCVTCPGGMFCVGGANPAIACPAGMQSVSQPDCIDVSSRVCPTRVSVCMRTVVVTFPRVASLCSGPSPIIRDVCVSPQP